MTSKTIPIFLSKRLTKAQRWSCRSEKSISRVHEAPQQQQPLSGFHIKPIFHLFLQMSRIIWTSCATQSLLMLMVLYIQTHYLNQYSNSRRHQCQALVSLRYAYPWTTWWFRICNLMNIVLTISYLMEETSSKCWVIAGVQKWHPAWLAPLWVNLKKPSYLGLQEASDVNSTLICISFFLPHGPNNLDHFVNFCNAFHPIIKPMLESTVNIWQNFYCSCKLFFSLHCS